MPQRSQFSGGTSPFGVSVFSTNWGRERTSTLASIASQGSNQGSSPAQSTFSKENGDNDMQMRTLDYLGLADTPQQPRAQLVNPLLANLVDRNAQANRFRSYSVNAKEKYAEDEEDEYGTGSMTPYEAQQALQFQLAATNAAIQQHNLAVQAFANQASSNRPRARTAGVLDSPSTNRLLLQRYYPTPSRLDNTINVTDMGIPEAREYEGITEAVAAMNLGRSNVEGHLNPEDNMEGPTRALWLGSIPASTTISTLNEMFKAHGPIISARVLTHKNCGFVNFQNLESAISAKTMMNGKEIFPGAGPVRINYAKPPSPSGTPGADGTFPSPSPDPFSKGQENGTNGEANGATQGATSRPGSAPLTIPALGDMESDIMRIVGDFGATPEERIKINHSLVKAITYDKYQSEVPPIPEPSHNRLHDAPKLRDIRKRIDNQSYSPAEIENIAAEMLPEIADLASDYLGNTVVQKLFEHCSDDMKDLMLAEIAPHIAEIGVHKNGTWAAQKIIEVCKTPKQRNMICSNVQPYAVPLFLDQYGNYVLQCILKYGAPFNDFIFESMLSQMWEIAQGRYGSRAMRACLESHNSTKEQQRMLAAAIALHSVQLATNANGALLLTWFLDTCTFPQRRTVLAPQLVPHLVHLCTHKVAYLTVLKVINQKSETPARDTILDALFLNDETLEAILSDQACGATLIFKVLTTPFFDDNRRQNVVNNIRNVLGNLKALPSQGYKRLMDEVGLSTRNGSQGPRDHSANANSAERQRPGSNNSQMNGQAPPQFNNQFYPQAQPSFDMGMGMQRTDSMDSNLPQFQNYNVQNPMFNPPNMTVPPMSLQQMQYLSRAAPPMNNYYPNMQGGFGGFGNGSPSIDPYRNQVLQNASPIQPPPQNMSPSPMLPQSGFAPPGFGGMNMNMGGYPAYPGMQVPMGYGMQQQEQPVNGRRGRVSQSTHLP